MSHATVGVIIPRNEDGGPWDIESAITDILEPYDEAKRCKPHRETCHCVSSEATREAYKKAQQIDGLSWAFVREQFDDKMKEQGVPFSDVRQALWEEHSAPFKALIAKYETEHPMYGKPSADCEDCKGKGWYTCRCNPDAKWDWWVIGGRWEGQLKAHRIPHHSDHNGEDVTTVGDMLRFKNGKPRPKLYRTFALVDEDGTWHENGELGWWGMVHDEKDKQDWEKEYREVLEAADPKSLFVLVDYHI